MSKPEKLSRRDRVADRVLCLLLGISILDYDMKKLGRYITIINIHTTTDDLTYVFRPLPQSGTESWHMSLPRLNL